MGRDTVHREVRLYDSGLYSSLTVRKKNMIPCRERLKRPFTLAEKIIYSHLADPKGQDIVRGKVWSCFSFSPPLLALPYGALVLVILAPLSRPCGNARCKRTNSSLAVHACWDEEDRCAHDRCAVASCALCGVFCRLSNKRGRVGSKTPFPPASSNLPEQCTVIT